MWLKWHLGVRASSFHLKFFLYLHDMHQIATYDLMSANVWPVSSVRDLCCLVILLWTQPLLLHACLIEPIGHIVLFNVDDQKDRAVVEYVLQGLCDLWCLTVGAIALSQCLRYDDYKFCLEGQEPNYDLFLIPVWYNLLVEEELSKNKYII